MCRGCGSAGSSPLARGLRLPQAEGRGQCRIIPARAGFTGSAPSVPDHHGDHPRSRGVYVATVHTRTSGRGSSPLARGLPWRASALWVAHGIIPARAGFTGQRWARRRPAGDHPRSRGVYQVSTQLTDSKPGSSPLARGLRGEVLEVHDRFRIIPARAGFTRGRPQCFHPDQDHPRSRGVYGEHERRASQLWGSSPLARGLLGIPAIQALSGRIIPARAGFTTTLILGTLSIMDHPRSRGVYQETLTQWTKRQGSSPLARGLHVTPLGLVLRGGIIPARAGFTTPTPSSEPSPTDHPRSRGVYSRRSPSPVVRGGSSPLARGLHVTAATLILWSRIIPARAGFTRAEAIADDGEFGSSPLARGLLLHPRGSLSLPRIIPARAGFTLSTATTSTPTADHPRSRGVYHSSEPSSFVSTGSSPLARGLLVVPHEDTGLVRIIPARAGFTPGCGRPPPGDPDHPRSRGVYGASSARQG